MFKIGEFSKLVRVSARMLRYYDKCGLLRPAETDRFTGYRIYCAAQIPLLSRIVALRDMGFNVEEIEELLPCFNNAEAMQKALERKSMEIHSSIAAEQSKLEKIAAMRAAFEKESVNMIYEVELKPLKAEKVLSLREVIPAHDQEGLLWHKLGKYMAQNNIACDVGGYSIYHDDEHKENEVDVEIAVPVGKFGEGEGEGEGSFRYKELPHIPLAATIRFSGPYEGYSDAIAKLASWVEQNGYAFDGIIRGLAIASPANAKSPEDYMTELQMPIK